jgi:predicted ATPase
MLERIDLCINHARRVGGEVKSFAFGPGLNVIVGPNASGKSTILRAIHSCDICHKVYDDDTFFHYFNAETMNPATAKGPAGDATGMALRIRALFSSHGQIMKQALTTLPIRKGDCLLVDEPETGQDLDGVLKIVTGLRAICDEGGQVVVASHHPALWRDCRLIELRPGYSDDVRRRHRELLD